MNKKLICTLISSCVMTQFLVACNSGTSTTASEGKSPQKASLTKNLKNGTDNIQGIWGAVTASDSAGKEGKTNFLINNSTDSKFVRLGCVSSGGDMPLTASGRDTIDPYSTLQMKENTNSHAAHYAQSHNGFIQSPLNEQESVLLTIAGDGKGHNATSTASDLTCYYKLDNGSDEPMYVKLVGHNEGYMVASVAMQEIDKPYNDVQKAVQANSQTAEYIKNGGTASFMAATALGYKQWNPTQINSFVDRIIEHAHMKSTNLSINRMKKFKNGFQDRLKAQEFEAKLNSKSSSIFDLSDIFANSFEQSIVEAGILSKGAPELKLAREKVYNLVFSSQPTRVTILNKGGHISVQANFGDDIASVRYELSTPDFNGMEFDERISTGLSPDEEALQQLAKDLKEIIAGDMKNVKLLGKVETWEKLQENTRNKVLENIYKRAGNDIKYSHTHSNSYVNSILGDTADTLDSKEFISEDMFAKLIAETKETKNVAFASKVFGVSEIAEFGIGVFGVQALMDLATLPPSVGSYDTSIASFKWLAVTSEDIKAWNAIHTDPEQQIKANTQVNAGSSGYNLSTNQNLTLSYNDSATGTDRQKIYSLENIYVDTPFLRASDDYQHNPWFGDVSKGNYDNGNALIQTNINELTGSPDFMQQIQREALKSSSLGSTVVPVISAPTQAGQATLSAINVGVGGQMTNGGLLSAKPVKLLTAKVKTKLGDVYGFIVPENTKLSVPIKVVNNTGFRDMLHSRALTSSYVSNDEGSSVQLSKSMKGYNNLLGLMPTVYSAFTCKAPYAYGSTCNYEIALTRGTTSSTKSVGKMYLSDAYGEEMAMPVFIGYNLILDQQSIETDGSDLVTFVAKVATPDGYTGLSLANLPKGAKVVQGCDSALSQGDSCTFKVDFSNVEQGEYKLQVRGKSTDGDLKDNDIENITVTVTYPW